MWIFTLNISKLYMHIWLCSMIYLSMLSARQRVFAAPVGESNLAQLKRSASPLASKVIFESPNAQLEKVYTEFLVTSKPLNLRKYNANKKLKKSKKDSKIYFIPIPAMPYRYIPGRGYDFQPMKINPIMMELPSVATTTKMPKETTTQPPPKSDQVASATYMRPQPAYNKQTQQKLNNQYLPPYPATAITQKTPLKTTTMKIFKQTQPTDRSDVSDSKIVRLKNPFQAYFFNGRPFKLQVAHAHPKKTNLTSQNLKSNLFFNKNIIY